ncbi:hypothetical protein MKX01_001490, partial [Papaver californicum]
MDHWVEKRVLCSENKQLVLFIKKKRQEMAETPKGISENTDSTLYKAYKNLYDTRTPVKTLSEFKKIKDIHSQCWFTDKLVFSFILDLLDITVFHWIFRGVGHWILKLCQDFFKKDTSSAEPEECSQKGKKSKGKRRYLPQKNSAAYALLISLYRGISDGAEFMKKQELIDAAEASGLSRGRLCQRGVKENLYKVEIQVTSGLVVKSSNPAKYMLTQEGVEASLECLSRTIPLSRCSVDCNDLGTSKIESHKNVPDASVLEFVHSNLSDEEVTLVSSSQEKSFAVDEVFKK